MVVEARIKKIHREGRNPKPSLPLPKRDKDFSGIHVPYPEPRMDWEALRLAKIKCEVCDCFDILQGGCCFGILPGKCKEDK